MNIKNLFPLDIGEVETETDSREVTIRLRAGWTLLLVYPTPDGVGGFFCIYVLGKRRAVTTHPDSNEYDQRHG